MDGRQGVTAAGMHDADPAWRTTPTAAASLDVPLPWSPCRGDTPTFPLSYRSDADDGLFGHGWDVPVPTIRRRTALGIPRYDDTDVFVGIDGQWLVAGDMRTTDRFGELALGATWRVRRFRPRVDNACDLIEHWSSEGESPFWTIRGADGSVAIYGKRSDTRLADPDRPDRIAEWRLQETVSRFGEHTVYAYLAEDGTGVVDERDRRAARYLGSVRYGHAIGSAAPYAWLADEGDGIAWYFEAIFDGGQRTTDDTESPAYTADRPWPKRTDPQSDFRYGFEHRSLRLCRQVLMFHRFPSLGPDPVLVRRVLADYDEQPWMSRLTGIRTIAYGTAGDIEHAPPLDIAWSDFVPGIATSTPFAGLPAVNDGYRGELVDLYGEGLPGILHRDGERWSYREPRRAKDDPDGIDYGPAVPLPRQPAMQGSDATVAGRQGRMAMTMSPAVSARRLLVDVTRDGRPSWVVVEPSMRGYFTMDADHRWSGFQTFEGLPADFRHEHAQWADLAGAGRMDLVLVSGTGVRWWRRTDTGYDIGAWVAHTGDRLPLPDARHHLVTFANVLGTVAAQLVRVAPSGATTCWASLGFGRFAPGVAVGTIDLGGERVDPARTFLADIDGTGTDDLLYATPEALLLFRNHAGHGFAPEPVAYPWPDGQRYERTWSLTFVDVTGRGSASAVITVPHAGADQAPRHWRMDFTHATPNLVTSTDHHRGCTTTLTYRSSVQAWLDEKIAHPEAPRLPFPVPSVASIVRYDEIAGSGARSDFRWRRGFHDAVERQTRGYAFSERIERVEGDADPAVPERFERTWRHVGHATVDSARGDFDTSDPNATGIDPPLFSQWDGDRDRLGADLDDDPRKELWRALAGQVRRVETFACRDGLAVGHARHTEETRYLVRQVHAPEDAAGVSLALPVEMLGYAYEDTPTDPRRHHEIALDLDVFGMSRRHLAIASARRPGVPPYDEAEAARYWTDSHDPSQRQHHITLTRTAPWHLDAVDAWLLRVPGEIRTDAAFIDADDLADDDLRYERFADDGLPDGTTMGLVALTRAVYDDDPSLAPTFPALPLSMQSAGLDAEARREWLGAITAATFDDWCTAGGWSPMVATSIAPGETLWAVTHDRRTYAAIEAFHRPRRIAACATVAWTQLDDDPHGLFVQRVATPDGLVTSSQFDYRQLAAWRTTDGNDNVHDLRRDAFGRELVGSVHGSEIDTDGRRVTVGFEPLDAWLPPDDRSPATAMDAPAATLGAHARVLRYDDRAWMGVVPSTTPPATWKAWREAGWIVADGHVRSRGRAANPALARVPRNPPHVAVLVADRYPGDPDAIAASSVTYYDGGGRVLGHARREPDDDGARWVILERRAWHDGRLPLRECRPHIARGWRHGEWPEASGIPTTQRRYDTEGRVATSVDPAGRQTRVSTHAWYHRLDDANRTAEQDTQTGIGTPRLVATGTSGASVREWFYYRREAGDAPIARISRTDTDATGRNRRHYDPRSIERGEAVRTTSAALGSPRSWSADAGDRWTFHGDSGATIGSIDALGQRSMQHHDAAGRPTLREETPSGSTVARVAERILYVAPDIRRRDANIADLPEGSYGDGGFVATQRVSLAGATQQILRRLPIGDDDIDWRNLADAERQLETQASISQATHDALGRDIDVIDAAGHTHHTHHDMAGRLATASVTLVDGTTLPLLLAMRYDADGHPLERRDANGVVSTWRRDPRDGRVLGHLATHGKARRRDLAFTYDPNGNVASMRDTAPAVGAATETMRAFTYDSTDQLIEATGREDVTALASAALPEPMTLPSSRNEALRDYLRRWNYDANGNVTRMDHGVPAQADAAYAVDMIVAPLSNRALPSVPGLAPGDIDARFDAAGNLLALPEGDGALRWDDRQRLRERRTNASSRETYLYAADDMRRRKRSYRGVAGAIRVDERRYDEGVEHVRESDTGERRDEITVDTGHGTIRIIRWPDSTRAQRIRYALDAHPLASAMTLDENGEPATYEEYHPFGGTALQAVRSPTDADDYVMRYSGKERDADGLYYYGARYYAPWLWRWIGADPAGDVDGTNRYRMARNNPQTFRDEGGTMPRRNQGPAQGPSTSGSPRRVRDGRVTRNQLQRVPTGINRGTGTALPFVASAAYLPSLVTKTVTVPIELAIMMLPSFHMTMSPIVPRPIPAGTPILPGANRPVPPGYIDRFTVVEATFTRPAIEFGREIGPADREGYTQNKVLAVAQADQVFAPSGGASTFSGNIQLDSTTPFDAYFAPQGGSVVIPRHPRGDEPTYLLTPQFSGCSLVVHQRDRATYEVFHVEGSMENMQYNSRFPPGNAAAIMSYAHYGYADRPRYGANATLQQREGIVETTHGFALMQYQNQRWTIHYQNLAGGATVRTPHLIGSEARLANLRVVGSHTMAVSNPRQRRNTTASDLQNPLAPHLLLPSTPLPPSAPTSIGSSPSRRASQASSVRSMSIGSPVYLGSPMSPMHSPGRPRTPR